MKKKLVAFLCIVSLCMTNVMSAFATEGTPDRKVAEETVEMESITTTLVNPLYADVISEDDLADVAVDVPTLFAVPKYEENESVLGDIIREAMGEKQDSILMYVKFNEAITTEDDAVNYVSRLAENAFKETSNHKEGDYLRYQYAGFGISMYDFAVVQDGYQATLVLVPLYYTTEEQEDMVDDKLDTVLWETLNLDREDLSDYEKTKAIYDYICENVTYDYSNLEDEDYKLKYTAYAALIDKTAVCQGYAVLFYRMMEEAGVDTRVVAGDAGGPHAWNISKLGDKYYYSDSTWDAGVDQYNYFLKGSSEFEKDHIPYTDSVVCEDEYANTLSETDFIVGAGSCGENSTWALDENGVLRISGTGAITDASGYSKHRTSIKGLVIEKGITEIGDSVFSGLINLSGDLILPEGLERIGAKAFSASCAYAGGEVVFPESLEYIGEKAFFQCLRLPFIFLNSNCEIYDSQDVFYTSCHLAGHYGSTAQAYAEKYSRSFRHETNTWEPDYSIEIPPTCTAEGIEGIKCAKCDFWKDQMYISSTGHTKVTYKAVEPTCTEVGYTAGTQCSVCGLIFEGREEIPATGHTEVVDAAVDPTCTEAGCTAGSHCSVCDNPLVVQTEIPALGHSYGEWIVDKEATCTVDGSKHRECVNCDDVETEVISRLAHKWNSGVITTKPTCTKAGVKTYTCSGCGGKKTAAVKATGHKYKVTKTTKATTKKNGKLYKQCTVCKVKATETLYLAKTVSLSKTKFVYNGKTQKPTVVVKDSKGKVIAKSNYKVSFSKGCKNAGTYKVTVKFKGQYSGKLTKTFKITKAKQVITASNFTKVKGDKAFSINAKRSSGGGKLTYKTSNKKIATVSSKGKVTIKKAGKVTITITAAANKNYSKATKKITVTIK